MSSVRFRAYASCSWRASSRASSRRKTAAPGKDCGSAIQIRRALRRTVAATLSSRSRACGTRGAVRAPSSRAPRWPWRTGTARAGAPVPSPPAPRGRIRRCGRWCGGRRDVRSQRLLAQPVEQLVRARVQLQPERVGQVEMARQAIGHQPALEVLDPILRVAAARVESVGLPRRQRTERRHNAADVGAGLRALCFEHDAVSPPPGLGLVGRRVVAARLAIRAARRHGGRERQGRGGGAPHGAIGRDTQQVVHCPQLRAQGVEAVDDGGDPERSVGAHEDGKRLETLADQTDQALQRGAAYWARCWLPGRIRALTSRPS